MSAGGRPLARRGDCDIVSSGVAHPSRSLQRVATSGKYLGGGNEDARRLLGTGSGPKPYDDLNVASQPAGGRPYARRDDFDLSFSACRDGKKENHATSRALGFFLAMARSLSAACRGRRVPCSQLRTALALTFR